MIRRLRDLVVDLASFVAIVGILGAVAWTYMSVVTVTIRNEASDAASNVAVGFTEKILWQGDLMPGQSKWTIGIPRGDGPVEVSYEIAGQRFKIECGYVTAGLGGRHEIIVRSGGKHECGYE